MKKRILFYLILFWGITFSPHFNKLISANVAQSSLLSMMSSIAEGNIMNNPSFEDADFLPEKITKHPVVGVNTDHWRLLTSGVSAAGTVEVATDEASDGNKSMKVNLVDIARHDHFYLSYDFKNVEPGIYEFSFYAKSSANGGLFKLRAIAFTEEGAIEPSISANGKKNILVAAESTTTGWTQYTYKVDFTAYNAPIKIVRLDIRPNSNMAEQVAGSPKPISYWFDDFYFGGVREKKEIESITLGAKLTGGLSITKSSRLSLIDDDAYFSITPKQASKQDVLFTATDPSLVEFINGEIVGKAEGNTQVVISSKDNFSIKSAPFNVTITADVRDRFDVIMSSVSAHNEDRQEISRLNANVPKWLALMNEAGEFSDINYADQSKTNWQPINHVDRLNDFVFAYTMKGTSYTGNDELYDRIVAGFKTWVAKDPNVLKVNFWYNRIDVPKKMGLALVEMRHAKKQIPLALEDQVIATLAALGGTLPDGRTGANLIDMSVAHFLRACLQKNGQALDKAIHYAYTTLEIKDMYDAAGKNQEGIHHDGSFQQHGPQVYIGGYGDELIKGIVDLALYTESERSLKGDPLNVFSDFVRNSYLGHIRGRNIHYNVIGRSVSRFNALIKTPGNKYIKQMPFIDSEHAAEYIAATKRIDQNEPAAYQVEPINKIYPIADYALNTQKDFSFVVRGVSNRTTYIERGNGENEKGYFMTYGGTSMLVSGEEYLNIFPVWNWARIPGVTSPQLATVPKRAVTWGLVNGTDTFVGGVSDKKTTVFTYDFTDVINSKKTQARKSWFIFEKEIVALGAGINSNESVDINTTLEQSLLNGNVIVKEQGIERKLGKAEHKFANGIEWALHNNIGYFFPKGGNVELNAVSQSGKWNEINTNNTSTETITKDVFSLYFNHGKNPVDATYAYIIAPNKTDETSMNYYPVDNIKIWSNTKELQVVEHRGQDTWQFVFFEAGQFTNDEVTLKVDRPCAIILKGAKTQKATLSVADPAQKKQPITVVATIPAVSSNAITKVFGFDSANDNTAGYTLTQTLDELPLDAPLVSNLIADTHVQNGANKDTNFGAEKDLSFRNGASASDDIQAYLKASLADMKNLDPDKEVAKVELSLYSIYSPGTAGKQLPWILNPVEDTSWDEMSMTYSNKPSFDDKVIGSALGVLNSGTNDDRTVKIDITEYAKEQLSEGKDIISMRLIQGGDKSQSHLVKVGSKDRNHAVFSPKILVYTSPKVDETYTINLPTVEGITLTPDAGVHKIKSNDNFSFSFTLSEDYLLSTPKVLANGVELKAKVAENNKYEYALNNVSENIEIAILNVRIEKSHIITLPILQGATLTPASGEYKVKDNDNFSFTLTLDEDYEYSIPRILANTVELTAKNIDGRKREYEITGVTADTEIFVEGLQKTNFDLKVRIQGIEQTDLSAPYYISCDENASSMLEIEIEAQKGLYINQPRTFDLDASKPGEHRVNIEIGTSAQDIKERYTLVIIKSIPYDNIVVNKFGYRLIANNNPKTNGNFSFKDFEWFKNGISVGHGSVYAEPNKGKLDETATYHLGMTTQTSPAVRVQTCPQKVNVPKENGIKIYPTVVKPGEMINIELDVAENMTQGNVKVNIYALNGNLEKTVEFSGKQGQVAAPHTSSAYVVQVIYQNLVEKAKIIVQ